MCATPRPKRKKVLGAIAGDIAAISALADIITGIPKMQHGMQRGLMSKLGCEGMEGWRTPNVRHPF